MKIVIAPDSFKGTMSSVEVCEIIERGMRKISPDLELIKIPIADGGEGTVDAYLAALGGERVCATVTGPLGRAVNAEYGVLPDNTAIIEMAAASGLPLVGDDKNVLDAMTSGTGELIKHALDRGCRKIILGIGGSATNDGGIGMAAALGARFTDERGETVALTGRGLGSLHKIDLSAMDSRLKETEILVACDVDNPLTGESGAAYIYGPQKGATPEIVRVLDKNLAHYAEVVRRDVGADVETTPGAGAAGGLGAGLLAFCGARLESGITLVLDACGFEKEIADADFIITGEGKIDGQSVRGKVPAGVAKRSGGTPVIVIAGDIGDDIDILYQIGITAIFSTNRKCKTFAEARLTCRDDLERTAESVMRLICACC